MRKTLLVALALIAVGCSEPVPRNVDELVIQGSKYLDGETLEPYSGPVFELFSDNPSEIYKRWNLKDGDPDGLYESYWDNRQLWVKNTFKDGERNGMFEMYQYDGQLWTKGIYKDGEKCGEWFENGETVTYDPC